MLLLRLLGAVASVHLAAGRIPARVYRIFRSARQPGGSFGYGWKRHQSSQGLAKALSGRRNLRFYQADLAQDDLVFLRAATNEQGTTRHAAS